MKYALAILLAASGCRHAEPADGCRAELSGNYVETASSPHSCPKLAAGAGATRADTLWQADVPSRALGSNFAITLDLGPSPTPGAYNSGTTDLWSAKGIKAVAPDGACVFLASNNSTPNGDFVLELTSVRPPHGTLRMRLFVLPRVSADGKQTDCGAGTTEELQLRF